MPPIAASSQSKAKLKAFQFHQEESSSQKSTVTEEDQGAEKENISNDVPQSTPAQIHPPPQPSSQRSTEREPRDCPQTPIGRLPLSELLASGDDNRQKLAFTPMERVLWENSPQSSLNNNSMPPKKKRKRAHSTSPSSSSKNEKTAHFTGSKQPKDPQALQQALETPNADPADDLWSRYSLHTRENQHSPLAPDTLPFPSLMRSSSPQTPAPHLQRDSGLRRALSCIEWPTSMAKRRKVHHSNSQRAPVAFASLDDSAEKAKISRVSLLVEKMHSDLLKQHKIEGYSSSEPAKSSLAALKDDSSGKGSSSPCNQHIVEDVVNVLSQAAMENEVPVPSEDTTAENEEPTCCKAEDASSDFGDEDLDYNMLEATNTDSDRTRTNAAIMFTPGISNQPTSHDRHEFEQDVTLDVIVHRGSNFESNLDVSKSRAQNVVVRTNQHDEAKPDEFDDDDGDLFAADLEDVFAKYDTQSEQAKGITDKHVRPHPPDKGHVAKNTDHVSTDTSRIKTETVVEILSDEEDFGDESEFEQMCVEATQNQELGSLTQPFVCSV